MVIVEFSWAAAFLAAAGCGAATLLWLVDSGRGEGKKKRQLDPRFVWICAVCTYNYVNTRDEPMSVCPRCGSYNKK